MIAFDPALAKLLRLRFRGRIRRLLRSATNVRGGLFLALGAIVMLLWLGAMIVPLIAGVSGPRADPVQLRSLAPPILLVLCVVTILKGGEQAIVFSPPEVDFLFAGPFTRRRLLSYKLLVQVLGTAATTLFMLIWLLPRATMPAAVCLGTFLALLFLQLVSMTVTLVSQTIGAAAYTRARKLLLWTLVVAAVVGLSQAGRAAADQGLPTLWQSFQQSLAGRAVLAPFAIFGNAITAERLWPDMFVWVGLAALVDALLLGAVFWLDANFLEVALVASQRRAEALHRAKRGGLSGWTGTARVKGRLPRLPWLGGAGPIVWRQATSALRQSRQLVLIVVLIGISIGWPFLMRQAQSLQAISIGTTTIWVTVMMTMMLRLDFRGDLDNLDWLKSLPLTARSVALGELLTPVAVLTALHWGAIALLALRSTGPQVWLVPLALLVVPANLVLFGVENFFFLLYPIRATPGNPFDLQTLGRTVVLLGVKFGVLGVCAALAAAVGGGVYLVTGESPVAGLLAACAVAIGLAVAAVAAVGWAFDRFDVSTDLPGQ